MDVFEICNIERLILETYPFLLNSKIARISLRHLKMKFNREFKNFFEEDSDLSKLRLQGYLSLANILFYSEKGKEALEILEKVKVELEQCSEKNTYDTNFIELKANMIAVHIFEN